MWKQYPSQHTPLYTIMYSRVSLTFFTKGVKANIQFNTHSRFVIKAFYHKWTLENQKNVTSSHQKSFWQKNTDSTHHLQSSISTRILTGSDPTLSRGKVFGLLHYVHTSEKFPA